MAPPIKPGTSHTASGRTYDELMSDPLPDHVQKGTFDRSAPFAKRVASGQITVENDELARPRKASDARDTFRVHPEVKARAEEFWRGSREMYRGLWDTTLPDVAVNSDVAPGIDAVDDDDFAPNPIEIAIVGFAEGNANLQRYSGVSLRMHHLIEFIRRHGSEFVSELWIAQPETHRIPQLPLRVVIAAKLGSSYSGPDKLSGLRLLDASDPAVSELPDGYMKIELDYDFTARRYHIAKMTGWGGIEVAFAYLESIGVVITSQVERAAMVRMLGGEYEVNNLVWSDLENYIALNPHFVERLWDLRKHVQGEKKLPQQLIFSAIRVAEDRVNGVRLWTEQEASLKKFVPMIGQLMFEKRPDGSSYFLRMVRGNGAQELGFAWLKAHVGELHPVEKVLVGAVWKTLLRSKDYQPTWDDLLSYLQQPGAVGRLWQVRDAICPTGKPMPETVVIMAQKQSDKTGVIFSGLRILTEEEAAVAPKNEKTNIVRVTLGGRDSIEAKQQRRGSSSQEIAAAINAGVRTFAPDAGQMEEEARRFSPQAENYGNLDEKLRKPEPLITPADVMPVPQLERPSDAVTLPQLGGFETTDPEAVKGFATPPSDKIPVIAAVSAMAMSVIVFFYGGAAMLRAPAANPAFGSGGVILSPRERWMDGGA